MAAELSCATAACVLLRSRISFSPSSTAVAGLGTSSAMDGRVLSGVTLVVVVSTPCRLTRDGGFFPGDASGVVEVGMILVLRCGFGDVVVPDRLERYAVSSLAKEEETVPFPAMGFGRV